MQNGEISIGKKGLLFSGLLSLITGVGGATVPVGAFRKLFPLLFSTEAPDDYLIFGFFLMTVIESIVDYKHNKQLVKKINEKIKNETDPCTITAIILKELGQVLLHHSDKAIVAVVASIAEGFIVAGGTKHFFKEVFPKSSETRAFVSAISSVSAIQFILTTMQAFLGNENDKPKDENKPEDENKPLKNNNYQTAIKSPLCENIIANSLIILKNVLLSIMVNSPAYLVFIGAATFSYGETYEAALHNDNALLESVKKSLFLFIATIFAFAKYRTIGLTATNYIRDCVISGVKLRPYFSSKKNFFFTLLKLATSLIVSGFFIAQYPFGITLLDNFANDHDESNLVLPALIFFIPSLLLGMGHVICEQVASTMPFFSIIKLSTPTPAITPSETSSLLKRKSSDPIIEDKNGHSDIKEVMLTLFFGSSLPFLLALSHETNTEISSLLISLAVSSTYTLIRIGLFEGGKHSRSFENEIENISDTRTIKLAINTHQREKKFFYIKEFFLWFTSSVFIYLTLDLFESNTGDNSNNNWTNGHLSGGVAAMLGLFLLVGYSSYFFNNVQPVYADPPSGQRFWDAVKHTVINITPGFGCCRTER